MFPQVRCGVESNVPPSSTRETLGDATVGVTRLAPVPCPSSDRIARRTHAELCEPLYRPRSSPGDVVRHVAVVACARALGPLAARPRADRLTLCSHLCSCVTGSANGATSYPTRRTVVGDSSDRDRRVVNQADELCSVHQRVRHSPSRLSPIGRQRKAEAEIIGIVTEPAPIMGHQDRVEQPVTRQHDQQALLVNPRFHACCWDVVAETLEVSRRQLIAVVAVRAEHANASADETHRLTMRRAVPARPAPNWHQERHRITHPRHQQTALRGPRRNHQRRQRNHRRQALTRASHLGMQPPRRRIRSIERRSHLNRTGNPFRQRIHRRLSRLIPERMTTQPVRNLRLGHPGFNPSGHQRPPSGHQPDIGVRIEPPALVENHSHHARTRGATHHAAANLYVQNS